MTTRQIMTALRINKCVVLSDDPQQWIRLDMFGVLVVVSISRNDEPIRKATLADIRKAIVKN